MDPTSAVVIGLFVGAAGGSTLSILRWLGGTEPFNGRKMAASIISSVVAGLVTTAGAIAASPSFTDPSTPTWQLVIQFVIIFGAAAGFGSMGTNGGGALVRAFKRVQG